MERETFIREVDTHLNKLLDAYRTLLKKSSQVDSQPQELQFNACSAQIAFHAQSLLEKVNNLRLQVVLQPT